MGEQKKHTTQERNTQETSGGQLPVRRSSGTGQGSWLERQGASGSPSWYGGGSPFSMMRRMMEDMDRMFEDFGMGNMLAPFSRSGSSLLGQSSVWYPQIEVTERDGKLLVRADLPGLRKEDVELEIRDDALILRGQRQSERDESRGNVRYSERSYGSFSRAIPLPSGVTPEQVDASFENGVLEVGIKLPESTRRRIDIRASGAERGNEVTTSSTTEAQSRMQPGVGSQPRS